MTAMFVALGGTSYAAVSLSHDSVGSWQIRRNGVNRTDEIADAGLEAADRSTASART